MNQYNLTLQIEVAKEQGAELLARACYETYVMGKDDSHLLYELSHLVNTEIYEVQDSDDFKSIQSRITELAHIIIGADEQNPHPNSSIEMYTEEDFNRALQVTLKMLTYNKIPSVKPHTIILGGQSGAGKTSIHRVKMTESQGHYIVIDGDSYRSLHPHFRELQAKYGAQSVDYTKKFAGRMVESVIDALSNGHYNLIVEGTLRSAQVPIKTATILKDKGYTVDFCLIATKPELSYLTTQIRYLEMLITDPLQARATPKEHHDGIVQNLVENMQLIEESQLFDSVQVYTRDLQRVYDSNTDTLPVESVVEHILFGPWTYDEEQMLNYNKEREIQLRDQLYL